MKKRKPAQTNMQPLMGSKTDQAAALEHSDRVRLLFGRLKAAIDSVHGRSLSDEQFGGLIGAPRSTVNNWLNGKSKPDPEALLTAIELLPEEEWSKIVGKHCRTYPTLEHARLLYDPVAVSNLRTLLLSKTGITLVRGTPEHAVTFVVTAMAHTARSREPDRAVSGIDTHNPDWFVPIPGVKYLGNLFGINEARRKIHELWPSLVQEPAHVLMLNGVWGIAHEIRAAVLNLARASHIIIGEHEPTGELNRSFAMPSPAHVVTVRVGVGERILIALKTL